ncbi:MAG: alpha/beta hydrolase [Candidatus Lustribacter sp.]|jgi:pimeloyl-ACP methyl ester carboxylesterase
MTTTHESIWLNLLGAEVRYYDAAGVRTRALESGEGEPLIMMHGVGGHAEAFARNVVPLGKHFRTIAIDLLGHGLTGSIDAPLTKEAYTKHLADFMDAAGIEKANLLGESLGGWIAVMMSKFYPERVGKIVYTVGARLEVPVDEAAAKRTAHGRSELLRLTKQFQANPSRANVHERLKWLFHNPNRDITEELIDLRWELYRRTEAAGVRGHAGGGAASDDALTPDRLRTITHPMLVLWTDHNPSAAVAEAHSAMNYLPNAELKVMEDSGHWPQWEHPEIFDEIVREYLQRR